MKSKFYGAVLLALLTGACSSKPAEVIDIFKPAEVIDILAEVDFDEMVYVEGGTFLMGAQKDNPLLPNYDEDVYNNESPVHEVTLSSYYIGRYEVTQGLWEYVMNYRGTGVDGVQLSPVGPYFGENKPSSRWGVGSNYPVYDVSYDDIVGYFLPRLNQITGKKFRLPTEAEWEYAARGGQKDEYTRTHTSLTDPFGTASGTYYKYSGSNNPDAVVWYEDNSERKAHPVGSKSPNALGIYDMSGNVLEWCSDGYSSSYSSSAQTNPQGSATGSNRVLRGGSWSYSAQGCRVSLRNNNTPDSRSYYYGLRLALSL